jgi:hypothetical protein
MNAPTYKSRLDHPRRCTAHRQDGKPCRRYAARGANVCRVHGGAAPQVIVKARERLALAADRMARELLGIATGAESEAVKLAAVKDALDRAGLGAKQSLELSAKPPEPWEDIMGDIAGVVTISREESRARRGLPSDPPALAAPKPAPPALPALDVEAVEVPPDSTGATSDDADRADTAPPQFPEPTDPPSAPGLQTLEEAATSARVVQVRRVR